MKSRVARMTSRVRGRSSARVEGVLTVRVDDECERHVAGQRLGDEAVDGGVEEFATLCGAGAETTDSRAAAGGAV